MDARSERGHMFEELRHAVAEAFADADVNDGLLFPTEGLILVKHDRATDWVDTVYEPNLCIALSGSKETMIGNENYRIDAGTSVVVSHHTPVTSRVTSATTDVPYLAVVLRLDVSTLRDYATRIDKVSANPDKDSFAVGAVPEGLVDAIHRYLQTAEDKLSAKVIGPSQFGELHFRILNSPQGGMLRDLISQSSHANKIAQALDIMNSEFAKPLRVQALAEEVGMSKSAFHHHFKSVTRVTPLQYQKQLRLHEAERILSSGTSSVTEAAFQVGYESPSQFSRDYSRKFGVPPKARKRAAS